MVFCGWLSLAYVVSYHLTFHPLPPSLFVLKRSDLALHCGVGNAEKGKGHLAQKWNGTFVFPFWNWAWAYISLAFPSEDGI
jgi:hypothetical protein